MSGFFQGLTDAIGLTDYDTASDERKRSVSSGESNIAFNKEAYAAFSKEFEPLQEELGAYFRNLSVEKFEGTQLAAAQRESQQAEKQIQSNYAQRGMSGSGAEMSDLSAQAQTNAENRAGIRSTAEEEVVNQKLGFYNLLSAQGQGLRSGLSNAYVGLANTSQSNFNSLYSESSATTRKLVDEAGKFGRQAMDNSSTEANAK